jgi:hypothetical protein
MTLLKKILDLIITMTIPFTTLALMLGMDKIILAVKAVFRATTVTEG